MKANRRARSQDDAVSTVLGGILLFALITTFLVVIRVDFAPVWVEEDEAKHMATVQGQIGTIQGAADQQAANITSQSVSMPITLQQRTTSKFFTSAATPASLTFEPGVSDLTLSANEFLIFEQGGQSLAGLDEDWTDVSGSQQVTDISTVRHLRLRLTDPGNEDDGDSVTVEVRDAANNFAGSLTAYIQTHPSGYAVFIRVLSDTGAEIINQPEGDFFGQTQPAFFWVDALDAKLHFADVLAGATTPLSFTVTENGMTGQFTVSYQDVSGTVQGSSGKLLLDWQADYAGGRMSFQSRNEYFPAQTYVIENGAVLLIQDDGAVMRSAPGFSVAVAGGVTRLSMTIPSLLGNGDSITSSGTGSVILDGRDAQSFYGTAPRWSYVVETEYPTVWEDFLRGTVEDAGLVEANGEFTLTSTATDVTLVIYGKTPAPASTVHDLNIQLHHAVVDTRLES